MYIFTHNIHANTHRLPDHLLLVVYADLPQLAPSLLIHPGQFVIHNAYQIHVSQFRSVDWKLPTKPLRFKNIIKKSLFVLIL